MPDELMIGRSRLFPDLDEDVRKNAVKLHGCEYYENPNDPRLANLAMKVSVHAAKELEKADLYVHDAGPLLIGETGPSYKLQQLVIEALNTHDIRGHFSCAIDCLAQLVPGLGRRVPFTTIYVQRTG
jgi:hypothetical protein